MSLKGKSRRLLKKTKRILNLPGTKERFTRVNKRVSKAIKRDGEPWPKPKRMRAGFIKMDDELTRQGMKKAALVGGVVGTQVYVYRKLKKENELKRATRAKNKKG